MGRFADLVPTNWLDSILTGPNAALPKGRYTYEGPDIERLLRAVKERIAEAERLADEDLDGAWEEMANREHDQGRRDEIYDHDPSVCVASPREASHYHSHECPRRKPGKGKVSM